MLDFMRKDMRRLLYERFIALGKERHCLFNASTEVYYEDGLAGLEVSLLCIDEDTKDLKTGDLLEFKDKKYHITRIIKEGKIKTRVFIKESK